MSQHGQIMSLQEMCLGSIILNASAKANLLKIYRLSDQAKVPYF